MSYKPNIFKFESNDGTQAGNGGGAGQYEPSLRAQFEAQNPQFKGQNVNNPDYQNAIYNWNVTTQIAPAFQKNGMSINDPGALYAAHALGPAGAVALKQANPNASAEDVIKSLPGGSQDIKGNPELFSGNATAGSALARAASIATTGSPGGVSTQGGQAGPTGAGLAGSPQGGSSALQTMMAQLPQAPTLQTPHLSGWRAFLGGLGDGQFLMSGLSALARNPATNAEMSNDTAEKQYNLALQRAQSSIELARMNKSSVLPMTQSVDPKTGQATILTQDGFGNITPMPLGGVPTTLQGRTITSENAALKAGAGIDANGQVNTPQVMNPQTGQAMPVPGAPQPAQTAPLQAPTGDPTKWSVDDVANSYLAPIAMQSANMHYPAPIAAAAMKTNQAEYNEDQLAAQKAQDSKLNAQTAIDQINANPSAFGQSSAYNILNRFLTDRLGFSPFTGVTNGQVQLSDAFIKMASTGQMHEMLENMGISRVTQGEVTLVGHAAANKSMPLDALNGLLNQVVNSSNSAIAEGQIGRSIWQRGKINAVPGGYTTAMTAAQNDLEQGKYPQLYKPRVSLGATNAPEDDPTAGTSIFKPGSTTNLGGGFSLTLH
jgi:hypothetical protein